jgi:hypothetical protein
MEIYPVMQRTWYWFRWITLGVLSGGILFQSACTTSLASGTAGLLNSVANSLISGYVNKALGVDTNSLAGLAT